MAAVVVLDQHC